MRRVLFCALLLALMAGGSMGCGRPKRRGETPVPAGLNAPAGIAKDVNPRFSHDGKRIVFRRQTPDRRSQIFLADDDLLRPTPLLKPELLLPDRPYSPTLQSYTAPNTLVWSPDDLQIAFERTDWFTFEDGERLPGTGLWTLHVASGRVAPLALHPPRYTDRFYYFRSPQWSPDGRYLAFVGESINGERVLFVRTLTAQRPQEVVPHFDNFGDSDWPIWEPGLDSGTISLHNNKVEPANTLVYRRKIRRTPSSPTTETLRRLSPGQTAPGSGGEIWRLSTQDYAGHFPPNEQLVSAKDEIPAGFPRTGQSVTDIFGIVPHISHLTWSPDGQFLAFALTPDPLDFTRYEIWILRRDGKRARQISPADGRGYFAPVWIGNSRLGALSSRGERFAIVTLSLKTKNVHTVRTIDSADCDWSPDRTHIAYASPGYQQIISGATTLRLITTGLYVRPIRRSP